ncbi:MULTISPECIES: helix-turn-helix domain-containing protein [unclassified Clostridioides]|uniref:winged helix-turn-helix domain-containing protein n=1 Tax=unclassified Clostridioides TaxID=2635829 RepID=UPI001D0FEB37|nr:winged helix-turn-helix domain-containing protein [Clostridioides sp. ES-S-0171-01]MCC0686689.1 winged helix-turn-helix domain-containing protein [Clostridioides sp. ES-S-0056-01]MCC0713795.1 winged helix-turn-helix domain-containing protein [Clostridioides sp. ES-S-0077-01]UDN55267.1 winged helix-turn-helix domain-containing protein [Clostridioides sp. ES-S-0054-01]
MIFQQTVKWLSDKLSCVPFTFKKYNYDFAIYPFTRTFTNNAGQEVYLTAKEFDLLYFIFLHKGQVFTKEQLYGNVWEYNNASEGSNLTSFIRKLRKKVEPFPDNQQYIVTVWGVGYKFREEKP